MPNTKRKTKRQNHLPELGRGEIKNARENRRGNKEKRKMPASEALEL